LFKFAPKLLNRYPSTLSSGRVDDLATDLLEAVWECCTMPLRRHPIEPLRRLDSAPSPSSHHIFSKTAQATAKVEQLLYSGIIFTGITKTLHGLNSIQEAAAG